MKCNCNPNSEFKSLSQHKKGKRHLRWVDEQEAIARSEVVMEPDYEQERCEEPTRELIGDDEVELVADVVDQLTQQIADGCLELEDA